MPSVAVIGDRERVAGFAALGLDGYPAHTRAEAETALEKAQRAGCALILVTAEAARLVSERLDRLRQKEGPLVLILPDEAKPGQADRALETVLRQAAGAGLWGEEG
ncbi:MAG: V-type ATP synthase subunit F [Clostridiales bacterium]|nr:V-type ATP synthase subunit F [Clostridiales bacterium]